MSLTQQNIPPPEDPYVFSIVDVPILLLIVGLVIVVFFVIKRKKALNESSKKDESPDNHAKV